MIRRTLLPSVCFVFSSLICLPSAQAGYLNVTFQGTVTGSGTDWGDPFGTGEGNGAIIGGTVTGSFLIDLGLSAQRGTDYEVGGDAYYSANQYVGPARYITSQVSIGGRNYVLGPSTTPEPHDEESVWMYRVDNPEWWGPPELLQIQDEYYYDSDAGLSSFHLWIEVSDLLNGFLTSLDLDQEFLWTASNHPDGSASGSFHTEADIGMGGASFDLTTVQASLVPTEVPEPATISILLAGFLAVIGLRRRSLYR